MVALLHGALLGPDQPEHVFPVDAALDILLPQEDALQYLAGGGQIVALLHARQGFYLRLRLRVIHLPSVYINKAASMRTTPINSTVYLLKILFLLA